MDNLKNMMAEMEKMQKQMQEMAEKQAADTAKEHKAANIKTVSLDDLNRLSEKIVAAEVALQEVDDEVNSLKQMILDSIKASQEEGGIIAQIRASLEQVIARYPYEEIKMGKDIKYRNGTEIPFDTGYPMFESLFDTIQEFKIALYDYNINDNGNLETYIGTLYRTVYCNNAEQFKLRIYKLKAENRYNFVDRLEGRFNEKDKNINISDGYESEDDRISVWEDVKENSIRIKLETLNKKRAIHLHSMQNEAMELLLAEIEKYI